jgi:predicted phosphoribosyltransferase
MRFHDRRDAGRQLAERLSDGTVGGLVRPLVLALPRGGVPVGFEIARRLGAPLEVFVARKVGAPHHPEFGVGAIAEGGGVVRDDVALRALGLSPARFDELVAAEQLELERRVRLYRGGRPLPSLRGRTVVLVDDGLATGVTAEAALRALRTLAPGRLVVAVPVCAPDTIDRLRPLLDELICLQAPIGFSAVGQWYAHFGQTTDEEVDQLLAAARQEHEVMHD